MSADKKRLTLTEIKSEIKTKKLRWRPERTRLSALSPDEQDIRLGLDIHDSAYDLRQIRSALAVESKAIEFASERDWRNKDGENWVTEVQDQGACGSCVAFATVAAIEAQANIQVSNPDLDLNLSEADLFFCGAGKKCAVGWWPRHALEHAESDGVADEECFPYEDHDMACNVSSEKPDRHVKVDGFSEIVDIAERKQWLDTHGPMVACMAVYRDFFSYKDGIYEPAVTELAGYHAVTCIGYSDIDECWICKNSWGADWGDNGFFKIAYGAAKMDTEFAMYGVAALVGPLLVTTDEESAIAKYVAVDYEFQEHRPVLWAYADGKWRHRVLTDAGLTALDTVLLEASPVQVRYIGDELTRITGYRDTSKATVAEQAEMVENLIAAARGVEK